MFQMLKAKPKRLATALGTVGVMVILAVAVIGPPMAVGQASRTWVSGVGDDANPCARTAPCKTFAGAISKTAAGGEINCLDPGGFGAVSITKSMTIDCTGTLGGILASSTTGVTVNGAGAIVTLRGLEINGGPPNLPGVNGVRVLQAASVHIIDTTIYNFRAAGASNGNGVIVNNTSLTVELDLTDVSIVDNGTATDGAGITLKPSGSGAVIASLTRVQLRNNRVGLLADGGPSTGAVSVAVLDSDASGNTGGGIVASTDSVIMIDGSSSTNNGTGITAIGANAIARLGRSTVTGNATGLNATGGGVIESYQTNQIRGNTAVGTVATPINQE